ncbi:MAG TPA: hypothetical protein PLU22_16565, partial [Polyangiaceae bacterium]|nr:hypothetical protein [Polyangiaceae bacterium]
GAVEFPRVERSDLDGGLTLLVAPRPATPLVTVVLVVRTDAVSPDEAPGAARLVARATGMALERHRLGEGVPAAGWSTSATVERAGIAWWVQVAPSGVGDALAALAEQVTQQAALATGFERTRSLELEALRARAALDTPFAARLAVERALLAPDGAAGGAALDATAHDLGLVSLRDCQAWHAAHVVRANASIVVVGDVEPGATAGEVRRVFAGWRSASPPPTARGGSAADLALAGAGASNSAIELVSREAARHADVLLVAFAPAATPRELAALQAAAAVRCASLRLAAPPAGAAAPAASPRWCALESRGDRLAWLLAGQRVPPDAAAAVAEQLTAWSDEPDARAVGAAAVTAAVRAHVEQLPLRWTSNRSLAEELVRELTTGATPDGGRAEHELWTALTVEEVARGSDALLAARRRRLVVLGDAEELARPLSRLGPVSVRGTDDFTVLWSLPRLR